MTNEADTVKVELLPCPFCGGEAKLAQNEGDDWRFWSIACQAAACPCLIQHRDPEVLVFSWNRRLPHEAEGEAGWENLSCDDQYDLARRIASNVGYVLVAEPDIDPWPKAEGKTTLPFALITRISARPDYYVTVKTSTLKDAQIWHDAVLKIAPPHDAEFWEATNQEAKGNALSKETAQDAQILQNVSHMATERDIYEVANQLEGYVGPDTPEPLARFLLREGKAAGALADEIVRLRAIPASPSSLPDPGVAELVEAARKAERAIKDILTSISVHNSRKIARFQPIEGPVVYALVDSRTYLTDALASLKGGQ